jgi:hypothetical protein
MTTVDMPDTELDALIEKVEKATQGLPGSPLLDIMYGHDWESEGAEQWKV